MIQSLIDAFNAIVARIRGASKAEDDAKHEANRKAAEAEVERRQKEAEK